MLSIVIPYLYRENSEELRFTLRSIEKNLTGYDRIFIIGNRRPKWLSGVTFIEENKPARKQANVKTRLLIACDNPEVSENFIEWDDDIYLLKKMDTSELKYYWWQSIDDAIVRNRLNLSYKESIINTKNITGEGKYYDCHVPIVYNKEKFKEAVRNIDWSKEHIIKTLYVKCLLDPDDEEIEDEKIRMRPEVKEIKRRIEGKRFFSTSHFGRNYPIMKVLQELFPDKSMFEL